jgi:hypothetical protein
LGIILLVAEVSAGCRVVVLLFRRHIRDDWLRGFAAAERVAFVRPSGGFDGHFAVWVVYCISIRHLEQNVRRPDENQPKLIHEAAQETMNWLFVFTGRVLVEATAFTKGYTCTGKSCGYIVPS